MRESRTRRQILIPESPSGGPERGIYTPLRSPFSIRCYWEQVAVSSPAFQVLWVVVYGIYTIDNVGSEAEL
jgi:hypothetical protein